VAAIRCQQLFMGFWCSGFLGFVQRDPLVSVDNIFCTGFWNVWIQRLMFDCGGIDPLALQLNNAEWQLN
jgi:hypothetical protein